ncbi:hypothetical protein MIMGU_mgv1a001900mg [Erythranthe guttata]|uniref:Phosphoinositide phospholipase C n=1 Tax=Erythranthe guttata TaxID=4155 RepID=A0A022Q3Z0_ERYGU|nr:hypothetical protein MIMGU_mgv1a001900mg [Erythranthe guttata]
MGTNYNVYKVLGCFSRKFKITDSQPPPDVREAFWRYAEGAPQMTADQLLKFLVDSQREEGYTVADAEAIIQNVFRRRSHVSRRNGLTLEDFFDFLFQDDLNAPILSHQVQHDMSGPLQDYFIYTGHNSYLTGNQLSSDCSEIPIINALKNGVRGIELDLWPNPTKDNVHVLHGRTLTAPVTLSKCLKSIREHAFVSSPYPVIVTLEDHLTPDLQAKVAAMVMQIFGDMLYCPDPECSKEFPSPEALKHKIILSTKPPKEYLGLKIVEDGENIPSLQEKDSSEDEQLPTETSKSTVEPEVQEAKNDREGDNVDSDATVRQKSGNVGGHEYKQRIGVRAEKAKRGLRQVLRTGIDKVNRLSQSERKAILSNKTPKGYNIASNTNNKVEDQTPTPHEKINLLSQSERKAILSNKPHKDYNIGSNTNNKVEDRTPTPHEKQDSSQDEDDEYKSSSSDEDDEYGDNFEQRSGSLGAAPEYKRIIGIHAGNAKKGLMQALTIEADNVSHRLSLSEHRLEKAASLHATDVVRFTQKNILRVFPKGTRVTSSNFRPTTGWMHGAQMVAFNMQGYGKSLWMMHGLFRANGGCGYFKKPDLLTRRGPNDEVFDPKSTLAVKKTLKVTVYMGDGWALDFSQTHFDAFSPPDFYTKVHIVGVPADAAKRKTRVIEDDWIPYWDEEFSFPLTVPELALLRIEVREHDLSEKDDFGGQTCLPVSELRPGIRSVPLYDKKGHKYKSVKLLMKFHFE